jgi:Rhodopirellula transposase DDE domain
MSLFCLEMLNFVMITSADRARLLEKYASIRGELNERQLRLVAAADARSLGHGGIKAVAEACGLSRRSLERVRHEREAPEGGRVRRPGGGRKTLTETMPGLLAALDRLVDPATRGDPMSPLRWTSKSTVKLAGELVREGFPVSAQTVGRLLTKLGYSLQSVRKRLEGVSHEDRDAQFQHINASVEEFHAAGLPVISVDAKKKELIGTFHNKGREWQPRGEPEAANTHDFKDPDKGKVIPYGVLDLGANEGWVSVGIDHDTAQFATETIRRWWREMGEARYTGAKRLLVTADCGGSNGVRLRLWKKSLQDLATELGLEIHVRHFPPGTSKWNKIEHRLFAQITHNWRGRMLTSREVVVDLIGATTTARGLKVRAALDDRLYPLKQQVSDEEIAAIEIEHQEFHGEWNYSIKPQI